MSPDDRISKAVMRVRQKAPFFAVLLLFARIEASRRIPTAATDGRRILFNPDFFASLKAGETEAVLLHEVLHCALLHPHRAIGRDLRLWNMAADIVVNGIITADASFRLPDGAVRNEKLEHLSAEEIYTLLLASGQLVPDGMMEDLMTVEEVAAIAPGEVIAGEDGASSGPLQWGLTEAQLSAHWEEAVENARLLASTQGLQGGSGMGSLGLGAERLLSLRKAAQIDWRSELWRFLVRTPCDFDGYDRRFMHAGLYLDEFSGDAVRVHLAIDTSGSIGEAELSIFMAEVSGILGSYPHVVCNLYYADADLYGPWVLGRGDAPPKPKGGGGTSFVPFFERVMRDRDADVTDLLVYLTDGYGSFPSAAPKQPVLWVVTPGGLASPSFPFGRVVRLS